MRRHLAGLVATALVLGACGGTSTTADPGDGPAASAAPVSDTPAAVAPEDAAGAPATSRETPSAGTAATTPASLAWSGTDLQGEDVEGGDFIGQDLVLWVWAPWCTICNREAPDVADVAASRGDVRFVGIAGKDELSEHRGFVARHDLEFFDHVADVDGSIWSHYGVGYQPAFVFITAEGEVTRVHAGAMQPQDLNAAIDELVAA